MQRWLLVYKYLRTRGLLAIVACSMAAGGHTALALGDGLQSASTLAPQIVPQDLEWDSTFANLFHSKTLILNSRSIAGNQWVSPGSRHHVRAENQQTKQDKTPKWVARKPQHSFDQTPQTATTPAIVENNDHSNGNLQQSSGEPSEESEMNTQSDRSSRLPIAERPIAKRTIPKRRMSVQQVPQQNGIAARVALGKALRKPRGNTTQADDLDQFDDLDQSDDVPQADDLSSKKIAPSEPALNNLPPLTQQQQRLRKKVRRVLTHYYNRPLNTHNRSPWELMHAMLAFEVHSKVLQGGPGGDPITAVGWLCFNQPCKRRTLMYINKEGEMRVRVGPALQGHQGQLLAMLAQSSVNQNYPIRINDQQFAIADLIEMEKRTCYPRTELTFKLIALVHYLESDAQWLNNQGMEWDIPQLIREELRQPVRGAACGGTHRLSGLTLAYKKREKRGEPVDGDYLRAKKFVQNYQRYAYRLQNSDGSFSTEWFRGRGVEDDVDRRLKTTGHILEWLLYASTDKELYNWRTTRAVNYLANIMINNRYRDWEAGPLGHAIHALLVYDRMVFGKYDKWQSTPLAGKPARDRK